MVKYLIIKQHTTSQEISEIDLNKGSNFSFSGKIDTENITDSSFIEDLNFIQDRYQKELNEKGEVQFMVYTKTYISLKKA